MATALQLLEGSKKRSRLYVIVGEDETLRVDALSHITEVVAPEERSYLTVGRGPGETLEIRVWEALNLRPAPDVSRRLLVVHHAERIKTWAPLKSYLDNSAWYPETTLVLSSVRPQLGKRVRERGKVPGTHQWSTSYAEWETWVREHSSSQVVVCSPLSAEPAGPGKPSPAQRWLSLRLPMTQGQADLLWRRAGGDSALARDVTESIRMLGVGSAVSVPMSEFTGLVSRMIRPHGPEDFVDMILFERREEAFAAIADQDFTRADWRRILGLFAARLDWLAPLHGALATNEMLDQVMRRLEIHRKWILHYAHREDPRHNVARRYNAKKVKHCRALLAELDVVLATSRGVPIGFGEALVAAW